MGHHARLKTNIYFAIELSLREISFTVGMRNAIRTEESP